VSVCVENHFWFADDVRTGKNARLETIWFFVGVMFFVVIATFIPEPEIMFDKSKHPSGKIQERDLFKAGVVTAIGISLHNFPEGIAVYLVCLRGLHVGIPLAFAIAAHNIPEGMAVAAPIYGSTKSKWQAIKWSLISGMCEPFGAILIGATFSKYLSFYIVHCSLAAVAGIMVLLSFREIIPTSLKYIEPSKAILSNISGMFFIFISVYYLNQLLGK